MVNINCKYCSASFGKKEFVCPSCGEFTDYYYSENKASLRSQDKKQLTIESSNNNKIKKNRPQINQKKLSLIKKQQEKELYNKAQKEYQSKKLEEGILAIAKTKLGGKFTEKQLEATYIRLRVEDLIEQQEIKDIEKEEEATRKQEEIEEKIRREKKKKEDREKRKKERIKLKEIEERKKLDAERIKEEEEINNELEKEKLKKKNKAKRAKRLNEYWENRRQRELKEKYENIRKEEELKRQERLNQMDESLKNFKRGGGGKFSFQDETLNQKGPFQKIFDFIFHVIGVLIVIGLSFGALFIFIQLIS